MEAISVVASGLLSAPPPPSEIITPMVHAGTLVATDGVNVMAMARTSGGNITVGPLSDFSQIDNTYAKPAFTNSTVDILNYGAGVFMVVDRNGVSFWSDDLGANWTLGTGHDPAFNTAQQGWYSDRLAVFMINNHQNTFSNDGKVKIAGGPQTIQAEGGMTQLDFDGSTFNYYMNSQEFLWYNTGTDYTTGWAQCTKNATQSSVAMATDGIVVANLSSWTSATPGHAYVRTSTDGIIFAPDIVTSGLENLGAAKHLMYHHGEWMILRQDGIVWTSPDLINWTTQGSSYLTGTPSGSSGVKSSYEVENIIRWGAGEGQSRKNFAMFFDNQIYQSTTS